MTEEVVILHENLVKIDLLKDFWDYQKSCRESAYYLNSMYIKITEGLYIVKEKRKEEEVEKIYENARIFSYMAKEALSEFEDFEATKLHINDTDSNVKYLNSKEVFESLISCIKLKEKMDEMQIKILDLVNSETLNTIQELVEEREKIRLQLLYELNSSLTDIQIVHSTDEDKIVTYEIDIGNKKEKRECQKDGVTLPFYQRARDYQHIINCKRNDYRKFNSLLVEYIGLITKDDEDKATKRQNTLQLWFNIAVTIATVVTAIIEILDYLK